MVMRYFRIPFAQSGTKSAIPEDSQPSGEVSYTDGYTVDYQLDPGDAGVKYPERDKFNELLYQIELELQRYQRQAFPDFITTTMNDGSPYSYSKNAYVRYDDGVVGMEIYRSIVNSNTSLPTDTTKWERVSSSGVPSGTSWEGYWTTLPSGGWLWENGQTIGSASSGATALASASTQTLYTILWDGSTNTTLPIQDSSGAATTRGASAAADFAANKRLPLPDSRGRAHIGKDDMGGASAANRITSAGCGISGATLFATGGDQNISAHTHGPGTLNGVTEAHRHFAVANGSGGVENPLTNTNSIAQTGTGTGDYVLRGNASTPTIGLTSSASPAVTINGGNTASTGAGASANIPPAIICNRIIKL